MRSEENPLDLNNLPDDYSRDNIGKQVLVEESSSPAGYRKNKNGAKDSKDDGKVYECRFCSLKFCKSQALGGHMNRHRQERETETLNKARQLVFGNDNPPTQPSSHLSCYNPITPPLGGGGGGYHHSTSNMGDPNTFPLRFQSRLMLSGSSSSTLIPPVLPPTSQSSLQYQPQPYYNLYPSHSLPISFHSSQYHPSDYYVGHVLSRGIGAPVAHRMGNAVPETSTYTCIGAPVAHGISLPLPPGKGQGVFELEKSSGGSGGGGDQEGLSWGKSYAAETGTRQHLDLGSSINRFQDGL